MKCQPFFLRCASNLSMDLFMRFFLHILFFFIHCPICIYWITRIPVFLLVKSTYACICIKLKIHQFHIIHRKAGQWPTLKNDRNSSFVITNIGALSHLSINNIIMKQKERGFVAFCSMIYHDFYAIWNKNPFHRLHQYQLDTKSIKTFQMENEKCAKKTAQVQHNICRS